MMSYEKIRRFEEKEDIFENSEFTCFCKFLRSGKFLHVRLIIIIKWEKIRFWYLTKSKYLELCIKYQIFTALDQRIKAPRLFSDVLQICPTSKFYDSK
jgi:hypothetical protein